MDRLLGNVLVFLVAWLVLRLWRLPKDIRDIKFYTGHCDSSEQDKIKEEIEYQRGFLLGALPPVIKNWLIAFALMCIFLFLSVDTIGFFLAGTYITRHFTVHVVLIAFTVISFCESIINIRGFYFYLILIMNSDRPFRTIDRYVKIRRYRVMPKMTENLLHLVAIGVAVYSIYSVVMP